MRCITNITSGLLSIDERLHLETMYILVKPCTNHVYIIYTMYYIITLHRNLVYLDYVETYTSLSIVSAKT